MRRVYFSVSVENTEWALAFAFSLVYSDSFSKSLSFQNTGSWDTSQGLAVNTGVSLQIEDTYGPQLNLVAPNLVNLAVNTETCLWSFASNFSESVYIFLFALENSGTWDVVQRVFITSALTLFITSGGNAVVSVAAPSLLQLSITNTDSPINWSLSSATNWSLSSALREQVSGISTGFVNTGN